jgi:uncharacterized membrane protein
MRLIKHLFYLPWALHQKFPSQNLHAIQEAIAEGEKKHRGEVRVAIEAQFPLLALLKNSSPHARALEVFSRLGVWDTDENNGVLIYICLADRHIEIVADRGLNAHIQSAAWQRLCEDASRFFAKGDFLSGILKIIQDVHELLTRYYPSTGKPQHELPDAPVIL